MLELSKLVDLEADRGASITTQHLRTCTDDMIIEKERLEKERLNWMDGRDSDDLGQVPTIDKASRSVSNVSLFQPWWVAGRNAPYTIL